MLSNLIDRIKLPFRKDKELYSALYDILGFYPHKITYYKVALMHKSLGHRATAEELRDLEGKGKKGKDKRKDDKDKQQKGYPRGKANGKHKGGNGSLGKQLNNERLEFLGDAILDAVVGDLVYQKYPGKSEGFLTNTRSKLVQRETLGKLAKEMGITKLVMSSGRSASHNSYMGGNAFEALVGAIYLDYGYDACMKFWMNRVMDKYLNIDKVAYKEVNFKSKILEWSQKNRIQLEFRLEEQTQDKNGSPKFVYVAVLEGVEGCKAEGFSKKEAQQIASELTLKKLRSDNAFQDSIFAAKTARTQMEEMPAVAVPNIETEDDGIVIQQTEAVEEAKQETATAPANQSQTQAEMEVDNLNLDDVTAKEQSIEDIIAAAEAEAYKEN